jgi:hypothetical protein
MFVNMPSFESLDLRYAPGWHAQDASVAYAARQVDRKRRIDGNVL